MSVYIGSSAKSFKRISRLNSILERTKLAVRLAAFQASSAGLPARPEKSFQLSSFELMSIFSLVEFGCSIFEIVN